MVSCTDHTGTNRISHWRIPVCLGFVLSFSLTISYAQCPPNIDFERGSFSGWTLYSGSTSAGGGQNQINISPSGEIPSKHQLISSASGGVDAYGGFPTICPNGSGYSLKLGNTEGGGEAEGASYEFTIPPGRQEYSLIYHYAVVFEDPNHQIYEQPRMVVEVTNVSDNQTISCASFYFVPYGSILPGFFQSDLPGYDGTAVWCKNWTAVTVNLDGLAGKTIRLFFKTADCTFRRHFGYAYIDVNSECSSEFTGASYCPDDTSVAVTAPYGYQSYTWFNSSFTQLLDTGQVIHFNPPPPVGTTIAVVIVPYDGYGCTDTLFAKLVDTLTLRARAGPDVLYCGQTPVQLGVIPRPGVIYSWSPSAGLSNAGIANPFASPDTSQVYVLTVRNSGGGCRTSDTVLVRSSSLNPIISVDGKPAFCRISNDSAVLQVRPADTIRWYYNGVLVAQDTIRYRARNGGVYHAVLSSRLGCTVTTEKKTITIEDPQKGIRYPVKYAIVSKPQTLSSRNLGGAIRWRPPRFLSDSTIAQTVFTGFQDQAYLVRLETLSGCVTVDTALVKVVPDADILVPSAFTPNSDGLNDRLLPTLMGIRELKSFRIFNRWGQLLYQTSKEYEGWNGLLAGVLQSTGSFVWVAEAVSVDGRNITRKGSFVLIR
jgi:gliding motility-associated-like protein